MDRGVSLCKAKRCEAPVLADDLSPSGCSDAHAGVQSDLGTGGGQRWRLPSSLSAWLSLGSLVA